MEDFEKLHSYHAAADAFGGRLQRPFEKTLRVLAPTSLPVVGGYVSSRRRKYRLNEIFSIGEASTQVGGSYDREKKVWTTIVSSVVKDLNVNNVLLADRIAAQISIDHSGRRGEHPRVNFIGTQFSGLRIGNRKLNVQLNPDFCKDGPAEGFPKRPALKNTDFIKAAHDQSRRFADFWRKQPNADGSTPLKGMKHLPKEGYNTPDDVAARGSVFCSLVEAIEGECAGTSFGHAIYIPDFGRVFLGELSVGHGSYDLTMVRLDLGSPVEGQVSVAHATAMGGHKGPGGSSTGGG